MKKSTIYRAIFYIAGLLILALGIVLNTKSGLGVSPIISISYSVSVIYGLNFGNATFGLYAVFVAVEIMLHLIRRPEGSLLLTLGKDVLQLPLSLAFTRFMNLFSALLPEPDGFLPQLLVLIAGIILTGIGAAMSLNMRVIPNPGDGIVQAIADFVRKPNPLLVRKPVGIRKNCFDLFDFLLTAVICLAAGHKVIGIGLGTVLAVLGVGRVIALFNHLFMKKMDALAGLER